MLHFFRLLLLLINIDQETVLNWFGTENPNNKQYSLPQTFDDNSLNLLNGETNSSSSISLETLGLIFKGLIQRVQDGLTLADIENILFFKNQLFIPKMQQNTIHDTNSADMAAVVFVATLTV